MKLLWIERCIIYRRFLNLKALYWKIDDLPAFLLTYMLAYLLDKKTLAVIIIRTGFVDLAWSIFGRCIIIIWRLPINTCLLRYYLSVVSTKKFLLLYFVHMSVCFSRALRTENADDGDRTVAAVGSPQRGVQLFHRGFGLLLGLRYPLRRNR